MVRTTFRTLWVLYLLLGLTAGAQFCPCAAFPHGRHVLAGSTTSTRLPQSQCSHCFTEPCPALGLEPELHFGDIPDLPLEPCTCQREQPEGVLPRLSARSLAPEFPSDIEYPKLTFYALLLSARGGGNGSLPSHEASPFLTVDIILYVFHVLRC